MQTIVSHSAGVLLYRYNENHLEVMLVHPGGPFWAKKDDGSWSIPKGLVEDSEDILSAAKREFREETGFEIDGNFVELGSLTQPSRKIVTAFAINKDLDVKKVISNTFDLEWPPKSGQIIQCPEIDKAEWFSIRQSMKKILKGQCGFITELASILGYVDLKEQNKETEDMQITLFS